MGFSHNSLSFGAGINAGEFNARMQALTAALVETGQLTDSATRQLSSFSAAIEAMQDDGWSWNETMTMSPAPRQVPAVLPTGRAISLAGIPKGVA